MNELREELEMILPCINCGVNAAREDGFGYCTCGNKERIDDILAVLEANKQEAVRAERKRLIALIPDTIEPGEDVGVAQAIGWNHYRKALLKKYLELEKQ